MLEDNLPMEDKYKKKLGESAQIRVVDEVFAGGEAIKGPLAIAYNLPLDTKFVTEKNTKRVMIRNVSIAKFEKILIPISKILLEPSQHTELSFDALFTHTLVHELMHGLGPQVGVCDALQELYTPIEEAKADICGLFGAQFLIDKGIFDKKLERTFYITFLADQFRSMRFGTF